MTQLISKLFPKDQEDFVGDLIFQKRVKSLEDRIEQSYQVYQLRQSLLAIAEIIEPDHFSDRSIPLNSDLLACIKEILKDAPPPTQVDKDRDAISEMVRRSGKLYVLAFLSPKMWQSLEVLFSGIVVSYIQMFSGGDSRSMLDHSRVFKDNEGLKAAHDKFSILRNKQYAHKELEHDRHQISYFVDDQGAIAINLNGAQHSKEYHLDSCTDLLRCLAEVSSYLKQDIEKRSENLIKNLTENQKLFLLDHAKST